MKYYQKALYDEMTSFYLITCDNEGDELARIRALMGALVRKARKAIAADMRDKDKIQRLLQLVYQDWGFHCDPEQYFHSAKLYLPQVLTTHSGMPVSIGAIVLYLADSLNLPLYPVNFPTQLILRADMEGETLFIDPWNGKILSRRRLETLYEGALGFGATLTAEVLARADWQVLIERFRQLAKNALIREEHNYAALQYIETLLHRHPDDPYEIRDRGIVLAQMGCFKAAAGDLEYFIEKCPQDPTALLLAGQLSELKKETESIH
ncbi:SirB1 family protein [Necropsobacter rosorum]|uniref:SirB1 family protein n=1 Tax=Necropsobacter rosorum TaxID=908285 RepID=UPI000509FEDC